jgi:hypothetical protein
MSEFETFTFGAPEPRHSEDGVEEHVKAWLERDLERLLAAGEAAELPLNRRQITTELHQAPHRQPPNLPYGKVAIYAWFFREDQCLKCGKAGPNSSPRYTSMHYNPNSSGSNLAKSLITSGERIGIRGLTQTTIGAWIRENTLRVNLLFPIDMMDPRALAYYEAFLHVRWKPIFEGREWI